MHGWLSERMYSLLKLQFWWWFFVFWDFISFIIRASRCMGSPLSKSKSERKITPHSNDSMNMWTSHTFRFSAQNIKYTEINWKVLQSDDESGNFIMTLNYLSSNRFNYSFERFEDVLFCYAFFHSKKTMIACDLSREISLFNTIIIYNVFRFKWDKNNKSHNIFHLN